MIMMNFEQLMEMVKTADIYLTEEGRKWLEHLREESVKEGV
jgi:hypothetical protein